MQLPRRGRLGLEGLPRGGPQLRPGETVHLADADGAIVSGPLTVRTIWRYAGISVDLLDRTHAGKLELLGPLDDRITRAAWVIPPAPGDGTGR